MVGSESAARQAGTLGIFVVDDHPIVRRGLRDLIEQEPDLAVCGEAGSAAEALASLEAAGADLAVVDLSLGADSGLELIKAIRARWPDLPVLVLTMHEEPLYIERALKAGARGYVTKDALTDDLLGAIRDLLDGKFHLDEALSGKVLGRLLTAPGAGHLSIDRLSDRELEVFELIGRGFGTREIAQRLHISPRTVGAHREHIKVKLGLDSGEELLRTAIGWAHAS